MDQRSTIDISDIFDSHLGCQTIRIQNLEEQKRRKKSDDQLSPQNDLFKDDACYSELKNDRDYPTHSQQGSKEEEKIKKMKKGRPPKERKFIKHYLPKIIKAIQNFLYLNGHLNIFGSQTPEIKNNRVKVLQRQGFNLVRLGQLINNQQYRESLCEYFLNPNLFVREMIQNKSKFETKNIGLCLYRWRELKMHFVLNKRFIKFR